MNLLYPSLGDVRSWLHGPGHLPDKRMKLALWAVWGPAGFLPRWPSEARLYAADFLRVHLSDLRRDLRLAVSTGYAAWSLEEDFFGEALSKGKRDPGVPISELTLQQEERELLWTLAGPHPDAPSSPPAHVLRRDLRLAVKLGRHPPEPGCPTLDEASEWAALTSLAVALGAAQVLGLEPIWSLLSPDVQVACLFDPPRPL